MLASLVGLGSALAAVASAVTDTGGTSTAKADVSVEKRVVTIDGTSPSGRGIAVATGGNPIVYAIDLANAGTLRAANLEVSDALPSGVGCDDVAGLGLTCSDNVVRFTFPRLAARNGPEPARERATYSVVLPTHFSPGEVLTNVARLERFEVPSESDGAATSITPEAVFDAASVQTPALALESSAVGVTNGEGHAAVGEVVDVRVALSIPAGTTLRGAQIASDLPAGMRVVPSSQQVAVDGGRSSASVVVETGAIDRVIATLPDLTASPNHSAQIELTFRASLTDLETTAAGQTFAISSVISRRDHRGVAQPDWVTRAATTVVAPALSMNAHISCAAGSDPGAADTDVDHCDVEPGDGPFTTTITVQNRGDAPAFDVAVSSNVSSGFGTVEPVEGTRTIQGAACHAACHVTASWSEDRPAVAWRIDRLAPGAVLRITYRVALPPSASLSSARATLGSTVTIPEYFGQPAAPGVRRHTDAGGDIVDVTVRVPHVVVTNAADVPDAEILRPLAWQIGVQNDSPVATRNLRVVEVLPPNWRYVPGTTVVRVKGATVSTAEPDVASAGTGDTLTWTTTAVVPAGATAVVSFSAQAQPAAAETPGPGANVAVAFATVTDANGARGNADGSYSDGPDADADPDRVRGSANLRVPNVELVKGPDCGPANPDVQCGAPVRAGQTGVSFAVYVKNLGNADATNVDISDVLPAGIAYASTLTAVRCSPASGCPTDRPFPSVGGAPYEVLVAPGFRANAATPGTGPGETRLSWRLAELGPGDVVQVRYLTNVLAPAPNGTVLVNTARLSVRERVGEQVDTGKVEVTSKPFWYGVDRPSFVTSSPEPGTPVAPASRIDYRVHYANSGNAVASDVVVTDQIPADTVYVPGSATATAGQVVEFDVGGAWVSSEPADPTQVGAVRWRVGVVANAGPAGEGEVGFAVRVRRPLPNGTQVTNRATVTSTQERNHVTAGASDPIPPSEIGRLPGNAAVVLPVVSRPLLELTKEVSDGDLETNIEGTRLRYSLVLANHGNANAANAVVVDEPPPGTRVVSIASNGAGVTCAIGPGLPRVYVSCPSDPSSVTSIRWVVPLVAADVSFPEVPTPAPLPLGFDVEVNIPVASGTRLSNAASATAGESGATSPSNTTLTTVRSRPVLSLTKRVDLAGPVAPGQVLSYAVSFANTGTDTARDTEIVDELPPNTRLVPGSAPGATFLVDNGWTGTEPADPERVRALRWVVGAVAPGGSGARTLKLQTIEVIDNATVISNFSRMSALQTLADGSSTQVAAASATAETHVTSAPTIAVSKTIEGPERASVGDRVTFRINVKVGGNMRAAYLRVVDDMPTTLELVSATQNPKVVGGDLSWDFGSQPPGYETTLIVVARVRSRPQGGIITNLATADAPGVVARAGVPDRSPDARSVAILGVAKVPGPRLSVGVDGPRRLLRGGKATYSVTIVNSGTRIASGVSLAGIFPSGVRLGSLRGGTARLAKNGVLRISTSPVPPGQRRSLTITLRASTNATLGEHVSRLTVFAKNLPHPVVSVDRVRIVNSRALSGLQRGVTG